jgi:hypothetical protein
VVPLSVWRREAAAQRRYKRHNKGGKSNLFQHATLFDCDQPVYFGFGPVVPVI